MNFFWAKTVGSIEKEAIKERVIVRRANHAGIRLQVSNYKKFKLDTCNWTPKCSRADYATKRRTENQSQ